MYKILGADQKEYGPAPAEVVQRWIRERRLDARSSIRRDGEPVWRTLRDFPEFAADLSAAHAHASPAGSAAATAARPAAGTIAPGRTASPPAATGPGRGGSGAPTLGGGRKTHGASVAALVIGLISPCTAGLAGIAGIIVGALALRRIGQSGGQLSGRGYAITGIILSSFFLVCTPLVIITALRSNVHGPAAGYNAVNECVGHQQQLGEAIRRHANDNNDRFPNAANWCDAIQPIVSGLNTFQCPARPDLRSGYAINVAVAGRSKFEIPGDAVLLFESDNGWNGSGSAGAAIPRPRHGALITVILADGTIRQVSPEALGTLRWTP